VQAEATVSACTEPVPSPVRERVREREIPGTDLQEKTVTLTG
jgi:hypothetical protein